MTLTPGGSPTPESVPDTLPVTADPTPRISQVCYLCGPPPHPRPPIVRGRWELLLCWPHNIRLLLLDMTPEQQAARRAELNKQAQRDAVIRAQYGLEPLERVPGAELHWVRCAATPAVQAAVLGPRRLPRVA